MILFRREYSRCSVAENVKLLQMEMLMRAIAERIGVPFRVSILPEEK